MGCGFRVITCSCFIARPEENSVAGEDAGTLEGGCCWYIAKKPNNREIRINTPPETRPTLATRGRDGAWANSPASTIDNHRCFRAVFYFLLAAVWPSVRWGVRSV